MITTRELLAAVKTAQGITSNYRLARFLDVPEKSVSRWNTGSNVPRDDMALRLAELAGLDPAEVLASIYAQRTTDEALRSVWERMADRLHHAPAALAVFVIGLLISGSPDAGAMGSTPGASVARVGVVCILC